jgi:uncharacterized protein (DUF305 family)
MRQHWTRWRWPTLAALALAIGLLAAPVTLASTVPRTQQGHPFGNEPLNNLSGDAFDQAFLAQMTMHHAMGVMMTQPVVASGVHQELKDLGTQMIAVQSGEIVQMRGWLQDWYGIAPTYPMATSGAMVPGMMPITAGQQPGSGRMWPGGMMPGFGMPMSGMPARGMPMMGGFASVPPDQIDATFMTWMIAHHQGAIDMAALAEERAAHQEVKDLAASIITSQSAEIQMMKGWLSDWYER